MANQIKLEIVSPDHLVYAEDVYRVIVKSGGGELGVLPGHAPMIAGLLPAPVRVKREADEIRIAVGGGFIEVQPQKITILATSAELPEEIDVDRAVRARERALKRLQSKADGIDTARAQAALNRAIARLSTVDRI